MYDRENKVHDQLPLSLLVIAIVAIQGSYIMKITRKVIACRGLQELLKIAERLEP